MLSAFRAVLVVAFATSLGFGAQPTLSATQKKAFLAAVLDTDQSQLEEQLPRRLTALHAFKPYFSMSELARAAYSLILESPHDMSRWRALAKIAAYADGEYASAYQSARRDALADNPRLFSYCPKFEDWTRRARRGERI